MHFNKIFPGLEGVRMTKMEEVERIFRLHVEVERKPHACPSCREVITRIHDYRTRKVQHLKVFERTAYLFYRKRIYMQVQRHTKEWKQALGLWAIQGKNFKDTAA